MTLDMHTKTKRRHTTTTNVYENHEFFTETKVKDEYQTSPFTEESAIYDGSKNGFNRHHRHTTSLVELNNSHSPERKESTSVAPLLPPKQSSQRTHSRNNSRHFQQQQQATNDDVVMHELSSHNTQSTWSAENENENLYISHEDIQSFPDKRQHPRASQQSLHLQDDNEVKQMRAPPPARGIKVRQFKHSDHLAGQALVATSMRHRTGSPTRYRSDGSDDFYTATGKRSERENLYPVSPDISTEPSSPRNVSPVQASERRHFTYSATDSGTDDAINTTARLRNDRIAQDSALPHGLAQVKGANSYLMDFNKIRSKLKKLYRRIEEAPSNSPPILELKAHFKLSQHDPNENILECIHHNLVPRTSTSEQKMMYVVDFRKFKDEHDLRQQIIKMFAEPGPPSISYAKVDAKMNGIINQFCTRVENLRNLRNELVQSPAHARDILHGVTDAENLVRAFGDNQLWIRWGTLTNLPPLSHLYMQKHPPTYELRKAVTISYIAERQRAMPDLFKSIVDPKIFCPPIYSKLRTNNSNHTSWQVAEYNESAAKFDFHECKFPSWLDQEPTATALLNSSNRTVFNLGEHHYALYSVYVIIIKDFTLAREESTRSHHDRESSWGAASKYQYYIGSSSTGVLYRFAWEDDSHSDRCWKVFQEASTLRHFRCYEGCDLIEACLALSWIRRQPRAVFVLNSFLPSNMSSLTLEQKKPFRDRMLSLVGHLTDGKKLGNLYDMRNGMNGISTIKHTDED